MNREFCLVQNQYTTDPLIYVKYEPDLDKGIIKATITISHEIPDYNNVGKDLMNEIKKNLQFTISDLRKL